MRAMAEQTLACDEVHVRFDAQDALAGVTLGVDPGEPVALVGPSGAGKTTLLRVLGGDVVPTSGTARLLGCDPATADAATLRALRARLGFIHQDLALVPNLRVSHNVLSGRLARFGLWGSLRRLVRPSDDELEEVYELLQRVGIGEKLFQRTDRLSGGEQQRVAIARALYQQPHALLADEPVSSVDPSRALDSIQLLRELSDERGLTLLVSLHQIDLARACFPRLVGLRGGRISFDEAADEVDDARVTALYRLEPGEHAA